MISLPIDSKKESFAQQFQSLDRGGRMVLTAPTGSGKSTRIPTWCADLCEGKILVLEPRRVAARTLAQWVAQGRSSEVGREVGYSVRFEGRRSAETRILFVTPGVARRFLVDGTLGEYEVVIFDEFHERSWETDSLLAVLAGRSNGPKLIIMSATLTAESLAERYRAALLQAEGRSYPVEIEYDDDSRTELTVPTERDLAPRTARGIRKLWNDSAEGSVLAFLPGLSAMREVESQLKGLPVVLLHGTFSQKEQAEAFRGENRKVVLATNVAESSLTIPGITGVVDCGLERRQIHQSGYVALATVPVAQSSADQRAGRAGRMCPGRALRLWSESARLEETRPPDLCRMELDELVLFFSALPTGLDTSAEWVDPPPAFAWERAKQRLRKNSLLTEDGRLTEVGKGAQELPVDQEWARLLVMAPTSLKAWLCDLCALATARRNPLKNTQSEEVLKARKCDLGEDPWKQALALLPQGNPNRHALHPESLSACRRVSEELKSLLKVKENAAGVSELQQFLVENWPQRFFVARENRRAWGNGEIECRLARGEELPDDVEACFLLQVEPVLRRGLKVELQGRWGLPVRFSLLRSGGLGEPELHKIRWLNGELSARVVWVHAGREISSDEEVLQGKALRRALAQLGARGSWRPEAVSALREEEFYRHLKCELEGVDTDTTTLEERLEQRLKVLGVEAAEELELIVDEDLLEGSLPTWEMDQLKSDYPKLYRFAGISFEMEYMPRKKRVVMHSLGKSKGVKVNPRMLPRWNSWKIELEEKGRRTILRP